MGQLHSFSDQVHGRAIGASSRYKKSVAELVEVIQQVEEHWVHIHRGHSSLFRYTVDELGLSEGLTYSLILVARKAKEVPALKDRLADGSVTLSKARKITSVLTSENQVIWLERASQLTSRQLEREVAKARPGEDLPESMTYTSDGRVALSTSLSEFHALRLRRAQDLVCQSRNRAVTLEETIGVLTAEYLRRHDPLEKARRYQVRNGSAVKGDREQIPDLVGKQGTGTERVPFAADTLHAVNLRDERRCAQVLPNGKRCNETRWLDIHHIIPVAEGGTNEPENLITLCRGHHRFRHLKKGT